MPKKSIFCIASLLVQVSRIFEQLTAAQFTNNDIAVPFPDRERLRDIAFGKSTKAPERSLRYGSDPCSITGGSHAH